MGTVGNLWINIKANTKGLDKGINKSKKSLGGFKGALVGLGAAMAAGFAIKVVKDFASAIGDAMGRIDEIAKFSKSIGVATESVQVFRHAAELTGVSVGEADKAFGKMVKNVGESSMGIGTATDAFEELGLSAQDLSNMNADQMFGVIADSIMQVDNRAQQASLAYDIFGRAGMKLLNTMELGSEGMKEMREEMEGLGVLFSSEDAEGVERANDAMTTLGMTVDSIFQKIAIDLAPAIEEFANKLTVFASDDEFQKTTESIGAFLTMLGDGAMWLIGVWQGAVDWFTNIFSSLILLFEGDFTLALQGIAQGLIDFGKSVISLGGLIPWFEEEADAIEKVGDAAEVAAQKKRNLANEKAAIEAAKELQKEVESLIALTDKFAGKNELFAINKEIETLSADFDRLADAVHHGVVEADAGKIALLEMSREIMGLQEQKLELINSEQIDAITKTKSELQEIGDALTESMQTPAEVFATKLAEIDELLAAGVITTETWSRAFADLQSNLPQEDIEVNIVTKGVVEGLQSALGTIKVGGEVSKVEQLAKESVAHEEKMVTFLNSIDSRQGELKKSIEAPQRVDTSSLGDAIKHGVSGVEIKVSGLNSLDIMKDTLDNIHSVSADQFTESKEQTVLLRKIADGGSGGALL